VLVRLAREGGDMNPLFLVAFIVGHGLLMAWMGYRFGWRDALRRKGGAP
jgi:hypothetical protein